MRVMAAFCGSTAKYHASFEITVEQAAVGAVAAVGIIFREKIMGAFKSRKASGRSRSKHGKVLDGTSSEDGENFDR